MVVVEAIALSTMVCNDLVMPVLLRISWLRLEARGDLTRLLLFIRRAGIFVVLLLGYAYYRIAGEAGALAQIGLVSFAVAAQLAPPIVGGLFWRNATRLGAQTGLLLGFVTWAYTMLLPLLARSGAIPEAFLDGPWQIALLRPGSAVRPDRLGPARPCAVLEHDREPHRLHRRLALLPPGHDRAHPGHRLRRRLPPAAGRSGALAPLGCGR